MYKRSNSAPRFQKVYTSRIKDGRLSNEKETLKNNYMSAGKLNTKNNYQKYLKL